MSLSTIFVKFDIFLRYSLLLFIYFPLINSCVKYTLFFNISICLPVEKFLKYEIRRAERISRVSDPGSYYRIRIRPLRRKKRNRPSRKPDHDPTLKKIRKPGPFSHKCLLINIVKNIQIFEIFLLVTLVNNYELHVR